MLKRNTLPICILAAGLLSLYSCKSTEVPVGGEQVLLSTFTTDWAENSFSDESQLGYFFTTPELGSFSMIQGEFNKTGGYEKSAFGFVFSYTADEKGRLSNYIRFEINTAGEYAAYAYDGRTYTDLIEAQPENTAYLYPSAAIKSGYDSINTLKIAETSAGYDLFINGTKTASITVPSGFDGGTGVMAFFSVGKKDQEQFPGAPVRVTYRITDSKAAMQK
ncbi:hypothetical protein [Treponema brennaborense]|uniref:Lipoprotein n=1 Tax=Treponema brennaborense (strain DSM 12168 / CIP 105900 / DD5/3) TaxID=906968 RepID=F4LMS5_TREBD|nr:hypothetical protein [Treponema brennaborense]AEE17815.1 hypothetical protein Trebr_2408 [Treponema brennaborense DSM 12168]